MPHSFTDANGKDWTLKVNAFTLAKIEDELGVSFSTAPEDQDGPILKIVSNCMFAFRVLWIICEPAAKERGINSEDFADALVGDPLGKAQAELCEAIADFHPSAARREGIRKVFNAIKSTEDRLIARANEELDKFDADQVVREVIDGGS